MRSGVGKTYLSYTFEYYPVMHTCYRKVSQPYVSGVPFDAIGMGPGIGTNASYKKILKALFKRNTRLVLDADAPKYIIALSRVVKEDTRTIDLNSSRRRV